MRVSKGDARKSFEAVQVNTLDFSNLSEYVKEHEHLVKQNFLSDAGWSLVDENSKALIDKLMKAGVPLGEYAENKIYYGIKTGLNKAFVIDETTKDRLITEDPKSAEIIKPFLAGRDVKRYANLKPKQHLILFKKGWTNYNSGNSKNKWNWLKENYPAIANYLEPFANDGEKRCDKGYYWWELRACDYYQKFEEPKIIIPTIVKSANYCYDRTGCYSNDKTSIIPTNDLYFLGVLNSKIADFIIFNISSTKQGGYFEYKPMYVSQLPIRPIDSSNPKDVTKHDKVVSLSSEKEMVQRRIDAIDSEIDRLVYELYGLTDEEIKIIEGSCS
jgi:hypothetical protein